VSNLNVNMWTLWLFGPAVEDHLGSGRCLLLYIACGVLASVTRALASSTTSVQRDLHQLTWRDMGAVWDNRDLAMSRKTQRRRWLIVNGHHRCHRAAKRLSSFGSCSHGSRRSTADHTQDCGVS
jgi:hypothetical protein